MISRAVIPALGSCTCNCQLNQYTLYGTCCGALCAYIKHPSSFLLDDVHCIYVYRLNISDVNVTSEV